MDSKKAIASLNMPLPRYIKRFALPIVVFGFILAFLLHILFPKLFVGNAQYILVVLPVICIAFVVRYPFSVAASKAKDIDGDIHYYITQMGALAVAQTSRKELFRILAEDPNYRLLGEESRKIYLLMDTWNMSLADACRFVAERTPSEIFADFLDRFAHAVQSGEQIEQFLHAEQDTVMSDYATMYNSALTTVDIIKEMFVSLIMSLIFLASFSAIMPIITGMNATNLMLISVFSFVITDIAVILFIRAKMPKDQIWQQLDIESDADRNLKRSVSISLAGCMIALLLVRFVDAPGVIKTAMVFTPLIYTGRIAAKEEKKIKRKDDNYPSFIRSLGSSAGARGGMVIDALKSLRVHDFGPLTVNINRLYSRLVARIDKLAAWNFFAVETGSNLIQRFSAMFVESTHLGAKAEVVGDMIATNFNHIIRLRKFRYQSASTMIGVFYGLTAGIGFTLYVSLGVVELMRGMFESVEVPPGMSSGMVLYTDINVGILYTLVTVIIVLHSFLSALMIRFVDGGNLLNGTTHFVTMVWIGAISAVVCKAAVSSLLGLG